MFDLSGKTILVTGGSRGIGAAMVEALAAQGAHVLVHFAGNRAAAEATRERAGASRCTLLQADFAKPAAVQDLWQDALAACSRVDVLINNAGIFEDASIDASLADWHAAWARVMQVNLFAPADLCRLALLHFRQHGAGKIINVSSRAAFRGDAIDQWPYGASKGALVTMTKQIARHFAKDGVVAFGIAPGFTDTEMVSGAMTPESIAKVVADIPLGAMVPAAEIGALTAFLCSDSARHLTGATFDVNGASYVR
jgi:3-oxoacyl-[acyl-carrier protein] reductase